MSLDTNSLALKNLLAEINALPNSSAAGAANLLNYIVEEQSVISSNKFDKGAYTPSVVLDSNGDIITNSNYCSTGYIHCRKGQKILVSCAGGSGLLTVRSIEYFDINKNRLSWASSSSSMSAMGFDNKHLITGYVDSIATNSVAGSYYVRIYFPAANLNDYMVQILDLHSNVSQGLNEVTVYENFKSADNPLRNDDFWYGKKIAFDGDSITYGYNNAQRSYAHYAAEALGCTAANTAMGGSTLAVKSSDPTSRSPLIDRLSSLDPTADAAVINIGSNDWQYSWTPFGDMSSSDKYTFYGALKLMCEDLLDRFSGKPIVLCTPIKRDQSSGLDYTEQNSYNKTLKDYADAIKEVAEHYGIPVLDFYGGCLINPIIASHKTAYFADSDGVHPNAAGHTILARQLKGFLIGLASPVRE